MSKRKATSSECGRKFPKHSTIQNSILECMGESPLVRIKNITKKNSNVQCQLLAKCDYFSAGGSGQDRAAQYMVKKAEEKGLLKSGGTIIAPSSGNTGIGLAIVAALKGYRCIITLPENMSLEKVNVLKALGAEIIRTPTEASYDSSESHIGVAKRLQLEIPNSVVLNQYECDSNTTAHYEMTADELYDACDGKIDMVVMTIESGGLISGIGKRLKERNPGIKIVGVDSKKSIITNKQNNPSDSEFEVSLVEGLGNNFVPKIFDSSVVDKFVSVSDKDAFVMSRRLIREEGLLAGGTAGAALVGALASVGDLKPEQNCVIILNDCLRNYMTQFLNDKWMWERKFVHNPLYSSDNYAVYRKNLETAWSKKKVSDLSLIQPSTIPLNTSCQKAVEICQSKQFNQLPVVNENGVVMGVVTIGNLLSQLSSGRISKSNIHDVSKVMYKNFTTVQMDTSLAELAEIFDVDYFALVLLPDSKKIHGMVTRIDLLKYITSSKN